jgi:hypothetical protein
MNESKETPHHVFDAMNDHFPLNSGMEAIAATRALLIFTVYYRDHVKETGMVEVCSKHEKIENS